MSDVAKARRRTPRSDLGDELRARFASNVRYFRKQKGLTQFDLAQASGLGRVFVNQVERGHNSVTLESIGALAAALSVRPAVLIGDRGIVLGETDRDQVASSVRKPRLKKDGTAD